VQAKFLIGGGVTIIFELGGAWHQLHRVHVASYALGPRSDATYLQLPHFVVALVSPPVTAVHPARRLVQAATSSSS
jgi:hypothetical protein